jgi:hypothetical protein
VFVLRIVDAEACGRMPLSEIEWWAVRAHKLGLLKRK